MGGMPKYAKARDANEPEIFDALNAIPGCKVERIDWPCDLVAGYKVRNIFLEVKVPGLENRNRKDKTHSDEIQKKWRKDWPGQIMVVTTPEQAVHCILNCYESKCEWYSVDEWDQTYWQTECGKKWTFTSDGPKENGVKFCHGCGNSISYTKL